MPCRQASAGLNALAGQPVPAGRAPARGRVPRPRLALPRGVTGGSTHAHTRTAHTCTRARTHARTCTCIGAFALVWACKRCTCAHAPMHWAACPTGTRWGRIGARAPQRAKGTAATPPPTPHPLPHAGDRPGRRHGLCPAARARRQGRAHLQRPHHPLGRFQPCHQGEEGEEGEEGPARTRGGREGDAGERTGGGGIGGTGEGDENAVRWAQSLSCTLPPAQALNLFRRKTGVKAHFAVRLDKHVPHGVAGRRRAGSQWGVGCGGRAGPTGYPAKRHRPMHGCGWMGG